MKAGTTRRLNKAFAECSSHEVLGGTYRQADSPCHLSHGTHSPNPSFARISRLTREVAARSRAASLSHQNKSVFMVFFRSVRQRLSKWRLGGSKRRNHFLIDERKAERKRIARELHDTLLQGLQGILLEMETFSQTSTLTEEQQERTAKIEQRLRDIVTDGRDAISALRSPVDERDWMAVILGMGDRLAMESEIRWSLSIKGRPWNLQPKVRSELLAILREGLRNAFEHSHAQDIRVILSYAKHRLKAVIQDNGIGVSEQHVRLRQKEGHWGIAGMRERADKLGGRFTMTSQRSIGTTVNVVIPRCSMFMTPTNLHSRKNAGATNPRSPQTPSAEPSFLDMC